MHFFFLLLFRCFYNFDIILREKSMYKVKIIKAPKIIYNSPDIILCAFQKWHYTMSKTLLYKVKIQKHLKLYLIYNSPAEGFAH